MLTMNTTFLLIAIQNAAKQIFTGLAFALALMFLPQNATASILVVDLGTASTFAVLAGSGVTNAGATTITGDVGSSPTATTAGFGTVTLNGTNHGGDAVTVAAKNDLATAYNDAVSRTPTTIEGAIFDLGGLTLTSGVYNDPSSFGLTGNLTLDAQGDPNAVWIFQAGSTLITTANSMVTLVGGAQAANVFWQVGSSASLGANTAFVGNMLVFTSVTIATGSSVNGSVLAENGAVALTASSITIAAIPEPDSALLLGCGLAILIVCRRLILSPSSIPCRVKA